MIILLIAGLFFCGCSAGKSDVSPTAVPIESSIPAAATAEPVPTESDSETTRSITGTAVLRDAQFRDAANGNPLLHIRSDGNLTADNLILDHAAGTKDEEKPLWEQAAIRIDEGGQASLTAATLASGAEELPLIVCRGVLELADTMAVHTGSQADMLLAANSGSIHAARCDLLTSGSGSACLAAENGGSIRCTQGTRMNTAADGSNYAMRLNDGGTVSIADGSVRGDILLSGFGNALLCTNTVLYGNLRFETAEDEIDLRLQSGSRFVGTTDGDGAIGVQITLDASSTWTLTGDAYIAALSDGDITLSNIDSSGFSLYYNAESEQNLWLQGKSMALKGGGYLIPLI